jgi:hypothetical protein
MVIILSIAGVVEKPRNKQNFIISNFGINIIIFVFVLWEIYEQ